MNVTVLMLRFRLMTFVEGYALIVPIQFEWLF